MTYRLSRSAAPKAFAFASSLAAGGLWLGWEGAAAAADGEDEVVEMSTVSITAEGPAASPSAAPSGEPEATVAAKGETKADEDKPRRVHSPWHIGFGLGVNALSRSPHPGQSFNLEVGGRINDRFSIGVDLNAIGNDNRAYASGLIEGILFPSRKLGFNVQGGLGVAAAGRISSVTTIYGGLGYGAGVGWAFQIKKHKRFNLGLQGRLDGLIHVDEKARHIWAVGAMLTFGWW